MFRSILFALSMALSACSGDETLTAYGAAGKLWVLESAPRIDAGIRVTLEFPEPGKVRGNAPCNAYFGNQTAPYPWFKLEAIGATKRACPELDAEQAYFDLLGSMTLSEVVGDTLILSREDGTAMTFRAAPPDG